MQAMNSNMLTRMTSRMESLGNLPLDDFLLVYFVIMNFVLAVPTVVFGLFLDGVIFYFMTYSVILFGSLVLVAIRIGKGILLVVRRQLISFRNVKALLIFSVMFPWCFYIILIMLYTPIFLNWDSMAMYMPMAKAMQTTGSLVYSPYYLSESATAQMGYPPLFPITFAFTIYLIGVSYIKLVPLFYFLFLLLLIFRIGSEFFGRNIGVLLAFLFLLMPSTQTLFGYTSLYLDVPWASYTLASMYYLLRCFRNDKNCNLWCLVLGMTAGLLLMSKDFGIFIFPFVLSLFLFGFLGILRGCRVRAFLGAVLAFFPYLTLSIWDYAFGVDPVIFPRSALILFFLVIYLIALFSLSNDSTMARIGSAPLKLLLFLFPVASSSVYLVFDVVVRGQVTPNWQFRVGAALAETGIGMAPYETPNALDFLGAFKFLIVFPIALLLVPLVVGLLMICRDWRKGKVTREIKIMMMFFVSLLVVWGFIGFPVGDGNFRRLIPLSVLACIIVLYDYRHFPQLKWNAALRYLLQFCLFSLAFGYILFVVERGPPDHLLFSYLVNTQPSATLVDLLVIGAVFSPYMLLRLKSAKIDGRKPMVCKPNRRVEHGIRHRHRIIGILFVSALAVNLFLPTYLVYRSSTIISERTWDPTYYVRPESIEVIWYDPILEVANYYSSSVNDSYATVTCGMNRLTYLLERPFVDLVWFDGVYVLSSALKPESPAEIVKALLENNMRYFLLPTEGHYAYSTYLYYYTNHLLFKIVTEQKSVIINGTVFSFIHLESFPAENVELYKLVEL